MDMEIESKEKEKPNGLNFKIEAIAAENPVEEADADKLVVDTIELRYLEY